MTAPIEQHDGMAFTLVTADLDLELTKAMGVSRITDEPFIALDSIRAWAQDIAEMLNEIILAPGISEDQKARAEASLHFLNSFTSPFVEITTIINSRREMDDSLKGLLGE